MFEVRVLGEFSVWRDGSLIPLGSRKYCALLAILALEQGRVLRREHVIGLLWEHAETTAARQSLRQAIYALRSRLPGLPLQATREEVWLPAGAVAVDALEFRSAVLAGRWDDAAAIYRGSFLDGFWLRDSPAFQEWQEGLQRNLASLARRAFNEVLRSAEARGDWARAMDVADRLLGLDPYDETAYRAKLQAIAASGDTARARIEFERLKSMLRAELDRDPEPETLRLVEGILAGDPEFDAPQEASEDERVLTPFHGREDEFRWLRETSLTVRSEGGRIALVLGEAGIGKTRFCRHFLRYAAIRGARILSGRCFPSETRLAYAGVVDALLTGVRSEDLRLLRPPWSDVVLELLPELDPHGGTSSDRSSPGGEGSSRRLFEGVARLLEAMSQERDLVLFIDDFQWADASTVALVHYLNRRLTASPVLVLLAIRPEDMPPDSPVRLIAGPASKVERLVSISLGLLSDQATAAIIESFAAKHAVQLSPALRAALLDSTAGHPFFLLETLKAIGNGEIGEAPATEAGEGAAPRLSLPVSVGEFLAARFATLSAEALEVMRALAVFGREANLDLLRATTGQPTPEFIRGIEELIARGLVQEADDTVRFIHDLVREAAYRRMTGARRRSFHERAAIALENMPQARPGQIAWHYNVAGNRSRAYRFALLAAEESERLYAHAEADYFLRLALSNAETDSERVACQTKLAALLYRLRRFDEAEAVFAELEQYPAADGSRRLPISVEVSRLMLRLKRGVVAASELVGHLEMLASEADAAGSPEQAAIIWRSLAEAAHDAGRKDLMQRAIAKLASLGTLPETGLHTLPALTMAATMAGLYRSVKEGLEYAQKCMQLAAAVGAPAARVSALRALAANLIQAGRLSDAAAELRLALNISEQRAMVEFRFSIVNDLGALHTESGEFEQAEAALKEAARFATDYGGAHDLLYLYANMSHLKVEMGQLSEAADAAGRVLECNEKIGSWWASIAAYAILGLHALERGQLAEARRCRAKILSLFEERNFWVGDFSYAERFLARLAEIEGETERALARLDHAIAAYDGRDVLCWSRLQLERARLLLPLDRAEARRAARRVRSRALAAGARPLVAQADAILARLTVGD